LYIHNIVDERTRFFACIYARSKRNIRMNRENEPLKSSQIRRRKYSRSRWDALWFLFIDGDGANWGSKTQQAFNEHGLMSKANRHYTRVSLDQSWWKWSFLNEENIPRVVSVPCPLSYVIPGEYFILNSFDRNIISSCRESPATCDITRLENVRKIFVFFISTRTQSIREFENVNKTCH